MIRKLTVLAIISCSSSLHAMRSPSTYFQLRNDLNRISMKNLISLVNEFVRVSAPSRMVGQPGHDKARDFILEAIGKNDPKKTGKLTLTSLPPETDKVKAFYQNDFKEQVEGKILVNHPEYQKWLKFTSDMVKLADINKGTMVQNIVWEKAGLNPKKVLVVTAHYDTISHDKETLLVKGKEAMPGANYNATGVAVALELVKALSDFDLNYSVQVVFLDWGGIGFHGSELHAKELKKQRASGKEILGVVNLEMLGQDTSYFDKTKKTGNMALYIRNDAEESRWAKKLVEHGQKVDGKVTFEIRPNGFQNSDNIRYWEEGFLSATFSQNWEEDFNPKFYQTPQDTPETLNHKTLWEAYQFIGGAVIGTLLDITK